MVETVVTNAAEALEKAGVKDGCSIMLGGFGLCGIPENLIAALKERGGDGREGGWCGGGGRYPHAACRRGLPQGWEIRVVSRWCQPESNRAREHWERGQWEVDSGQW